jgi:predicted RNase H-like HicB family nuclease
MSKPVYTIRAERDGAWWALDVPELSGVHSQSKRLDQAKAMIQDVIDLMYDRSPDTYELKLEVDPSIAAIVAELNALQAEADAAAARARDAQQDAVKRLRSRGLPQRDVGQVLGVSHQRVAQITSGSGAYKRAATRNPSLNVGKAQNPGMLVRDLEETLAARSRRKTRS